MASSGISHSFEGVESALSVRVDLSAGWKLHERQEADRSKLTWCFSEQLASVDSKFNQKLRIGVSVFPRPNRKLKVYRLNENLASTLPDLAQTERIVPPLKLARDERPEGLFVNGREIHFIDDPAGGAAVATLSANHHDVDVTVRLFSPNGTYNPKLPWREGAGETALVHLQFMDLAPVGPYNMSNVPSSVLYEVQVLLVFQPPARKPSPIYRDWEKRFCPGGLPSLGKKRR